MKRVVIAAARHRGVGPHDGEALLRDETIVERIITEAVARYTQAGFFVLGLGADLGLNKAIAEVAGRCGISYVQILFSFCLRWPLLDQELLGMARHAALVELGTEFHLFVTRARASQIEDLLQRLEGIPSLPYTLYGEEGAIVANRP
jgi:hypothetical protein